MKYGLINRLERMEELIAESNGTDSTIIVFGISTEKWDADHQQFKVDERNIPYESYVCPKSLQYILQKCPNLYELRKMTKQKGVCLIVFPSEESMDDIWME